MDETPLDAESCKYTLTNKFLEVVAPHQHEQLKAKGLLLNFCDLDELNKVKAKHLVRSMNKFGLKIQNIVNRTRVTHSNGGERD